MNLPELLTPDEVSKYFKVPRQTVYGWIYRKRLPFYKVGHSIRIRADFIKNRIMMGRGKILNDMS